MALTGWIATHTGLPCIVPDGAGPLYAGDRLLDVVTEAAVGTPVSDPLAPLGEAVEYRRGESVLRLTRPSVGDHMITAPSGRPAARVRLLGDDEVTLSPWESSLTTSLGSADVWPLTPRPDTVVVDAVTSGHHSATLAALVTAREPLVMLHDPAACRLRGCDIPPVRVGVVTRSSHRRSARRDWAHRQWALTVALRDTLEDPTAPPSLRRRGHAAPVVTWGEWEAVARTWPSADPTYLDVCRTVAGMPR